MAHLCDLVDFAFEMKTKLDEINKHSFNKFQLRIGQQSAISEMIKSQFLQYK